MKALFFSADDGYRDPGLGRADHLPARCRLRLSALPRWPPAAELATAGVTDAATFSGFYWAQQWTTAGLLLALSAGFGVAGGLLYGAGARPRAT